MQLELNLVRDANNNKGFYRYINQKRKVKGSIPPLMRKTGKLVMDKEEAEVLNGFFASVFTGSPSFHTLSGWTTRQGLGEQSPSNYKRRPDS